MELQSPGNLLEALMDEFINFSISIRISNSRQNSSWIMERDRIFHNSTSFNFFLVFRSTKQQEEEGLLRSDLPIIYEFYYLNPRTDSDTGT